MNVKIKSNDESVSDTKFKKFMPELCTESFIKSRIYNIDSRKRPAELVRKDLISAMKLPDYEVLNREDYILILDPWREEWEKGVQVPVNPSSLPESSVETINECKNDKEKFILPKNFITHENIFDNETSYELDLQDISWLQALKESDLELELSQNFLEYVIDQFEQQCIKNIKAHQIGIEYDDQVVCDICKNPDSEDNNEMVFCELCNICVHQACYGIENIPEGDWFCKPCKDLGAKKKNVLCILCPNIGGALKPIKTNKWAHVSCINWIPEAKFINPNTLELIDIRSIPNWRWNLVCSLCNIKKGAPILCDEKNCRVAYHVTCAFKNKNMRFTIADNDSNIKLKSYCINHSKNNENAKNEIDYFCNNPSKNRDSNASNNDNDNKNEKNEKSNPLNEFWKYVDFNQVCLQISRRYLDDHNNDSCSIANIELTSTTLNQIVSLIFQYWKLKRISNYGNSLIKLTCAENFEKQLKSWKNRILSFRFLFERLRTLTYMLIKRERLKQAWVATQKDIIESVFSLIDQKMNDPNNEQPNTLKASHQKLFLKLINHNSIYKQNYTTRKLGNDNILENTNSTINRLISEIKNLDRHKSIVNPYAKYYINSTKSRKLLLDNKSNHITSQTDKSDNDRKLLVSNNNETNTNSNNISVNLPHSTNNTLNNLNNKGNLPFNDINSNVNFSPNKINNRRNRHRKLKLSNENYSPNYDVKIPKSPINRYKLIKSKNKINTRRLIH